MGEQPWPIASAAAVVSLNMIHIVPWAAGMALIRGAAAVLEPGGLLFLTAAGTGTINRHFLAQRRNRSYDLRI